MGAPAGIHRFFEWRDEWTLEVGFMDEDHRMLAGALNRLARDFGVPAGIAAPASYAPGRGSPCLVAALNRLGRHVREHFLREEDVMRTLDYPDFPSHKSEHDILMAEFSMMVREVKESGDGHLDLAFLEALKTWLMGHVLDVDRQLAEFLKGASRNEVVGAE
jgi:hemerythrin-like metal-binding protein